METSTCWDCGQKNKIKWKIFSLLFLVKDTVQQIGIIIFIKHQCSRIFFFFFFFFGCTCSMHKFPGQGLNPCHKPWQQWATINSSRMIFNKCSKCRLIRRSRNKLQKYSTSPWTTKSCMKCPVVILGNLNYYWLKITLFWSSRRGSVVNESD